MYFKYVFMMSITLFLGFKFSSTMSYSDVCLEKIHSIIVGISLNLLGQFLHCYSKLFVFE